jgi:hypothetical protein
LKAELKSLSILALLTLGNQAGAHGLAVPFSIGHHAVITNSHALNLLVKPSAHANFITTRIPGLSGSASIYRNEVKLYTGQGIIAGIVGQFNKGNINTGQLVGTTYFQFYGSNQTHVTNT